MFDVAPPSELSSATGPSRARRVVLLVVAAVILGASGLMFMSNLLKPPERPLRVAISPWPGYEFATLAQAKGFFELEGVEVRIVELSSLGDCKRAFERGQVDGMFSTIVEVLLAQRNGQRNAQITLIVDCSDGADEILATPSIEGIEGLRGKRVAVEAGSLNEVFLLRALTAAGMTWDDVSVVWTPQLDMPRAFADGQIDAAVCYPPISLEIARLGGRQVFSSKSIPGVILDVLAFDPAVVQDRRADIEAFQRAFFRAQDYARQAPEDAFSIMAARQGISSEELSTALVNGIRIVDRESQAEFLGRGGELARVEELIARDLDTLDGIDRTGTSIAESSDKHE